MKNWIETYQLENGDFDISDVNKELVSQIPSAIQMGKVYQRLIVDTTLWNENYVDEIYRVYNSDICDIIPFLTVSKNKIAAMPGNIGVVAILTVVLNYSILFSSFTFFLDGFHLAF